MPWAREWRSQRVIIKLIASCKNNNTYKQVEKGACASEGVGKVSDCLERFNKKNPGTH